MTSIVSRENIGFPAHITQKKITFLEFDSTTKKIVFWLSIVSVIGLPFALIGRIIDVTLQNRAVVRSSAESRTTDYVTRTAQQIIPSKGAPGVSDSASTAAIPIPSGVASALVLTPNMPLVELQAALRTHIRPRTSVNIPPGEIMTRHDASKRAFAAALEQTGLGRVSYIDASRFTPVESDETTVLRSDIFSWATTLGVERDIPEEARQPGLIHVFQTASQYNGGEAPNIFTPVPGNAMGASETDHTQGPLAERTNPFLFELVNAYFANGGYNMLAGVLDPSLMSGEATALRHGYLAPTREGQWEAIAQQMENSWSRLEQPVIESFLPSGGSVLLMLSAAPASGYARVRDPVHEFRVQYLVAKANYTAQFAEVLSIARANRTQRVVYHPCAVGLGVFANAPEAVARGFRAAALAFQREVVAEGLNIRVQLEVYHGTGEGADMADRLGLIQQERVRA